MQINLNVTLEGADAENFVEIAGTGRNEFPENEHAGALEIVSAALEVMASATMHPRTRLIFQRAVQKRVVARKATAQKPQMATA